MTINTNISAIAAQNSLRTSSLNQQTSMERLSSGMRINNAKDDAAGLAISTRMTASIRGMAAAIRNANDGISMTQTAEGSLSAIQDNLQRIRELAVQASNDSNGTTDRQSLNKESTALLDEITRVVNVTTFNGNKLIDGSFSSKIIQVGSGNTANVDTISVTIGNSTLNGLGLLVASGSSIVTMNAAGASVTTTSAGSTYAVDLTTQGNSSTSLGLLDTAINNVTNLRSDMGAYQNRFNAAITNLQNTTMNLQASRSRILDTDYAAETTNLARAQIIQQAATAMLAQANQSSQTVLALLK